MRLFSFLFNLITLFPIKPEVGIKNHIIMSEEKKKVDINQLSYYTKGNKIDNIITFNLENNIYLSKFLDKEDILKLKSSKSNYIKFGNSEYINYMNFDDYCKLEKKISNLIDSYISDNEKNYLIIVDDIFLGYDGIFKYLKYPYKSLFILNEKNSYANYIIVNLKKENI
tara:strand:+ start:372 stop:878 length:507 start_codon:yes stop_codon:yes gene_type:complete